MSCSQGEVLICIHQFSLVVFYRKGEGEILFIYLFLFSMCAHHVPKVFPNTFLKMFPIAPWFYSIRFAQSSIPMYINWKGGLWARKYICFYFTIEVQRGAPIGECPTILKRLMISRWLWVFKIIIIIMKAPLNYFIWITIGMKYPKQVSILLSWFELNLMDLRSRCTI
jgi:hypothetical protein